MKTLEEIVKQEPVYLNYWSEKFDVVADFEGIYMTKKEYEATESPYPNKAVWLEKKK